MNWEAFFGVLLAVGVIAAVCLAGYACMQFVAWSRSAISHRFGDGWGMALFGTYVVLGIATIVGLECDE